MILIYNVPGILMVLGAGAMGLLVCLLLQNLDKPGRLPGAGAMITFGLVCVVADLAYRLRQPTDTTVRKLLSPSLGGMLYWIPVWIVAGGVGIMGCIALLANK